MGAEHDAESKIDVYAQIMVEIAESTVDRATTLAKHGLDEARWDAIDDAWQARLSDATDALKEDQAVPELVTAYAEAFSRAQKARAEELPVVPFEKFVLATRLMQRDGDILAVMQKAGLTLQEYLRANQYWTKKIVDDPELAARFSERMK